MKHKLFRFLIIFLIIFSIFLLVFGRAIPSSIKIHNKNLNESFALRMGKNLFYRQTINNCGPYSVMAVINILTEDEKNPDNLRKTIIDENCTEGNRYYTYEEFINLWNNGGYKLFFRNWAIVCKI